MPLYFSEIAPVCPISSDSPLGPLQPSPRMHNTTLPRAYDLPSAINLANWTRVIVTAIVRDTVRNNVYPAKGGGKVSMGKDKFKNKTARWVEQKDKRVKRKYKYFGTDEKGNEDKENYATMERIERMVWYDRAWKSYMIWEYGDKGEGTPI